MNYLTGIAAGFPTPRRVHERIFKLASFLIFLIGAGWSLPAAAFSAACDLQSQSATPVTTSPSTSVGVTYTVVDQGNCAAAGGMPYTISITGDTTGGATLDPPTTATGIQAPGPQGFSVTPGASTGSFSVTIFCNAFCSTTSSLTWVVDAAAANVTATKSVSGPFGVGDTVTYTVTLTNTGTGLQADNPGDELVDVLPPELTLVSAAGTAGTAVANVGTNTVTWNGSLAPLGASVTITISATIEAGTEGLLVSNQGVATVDVDLNGSNETAVPTDDPAVGGAADPTVFTVGGASVAMSGTKTAAGSFVPGGTVTYTIVLTNTGNVAQPDNPGDEFVDVLPAGLELVSAAATSGTAIADLGLDTVTWNGAIPDGGSVTITIVADIDAGASGDISNQGTLNFDADANGTNESSTTTDDPTVAGANDPTSISLGGVAGIPTLSEIGLALLAFGLMGLGWTFLRRLA